MRRLTTPKWLVTHALVIGAVLLFVALGLWQLRRGEGGNLRSYGYALEWPSFALLTIGFWAKIARDEVRPKAGAEPRGGKRRASAEGAARRAPVRTADEAELDAYNQYLADRARQRQAG